MARVRVSIPAAVNNFGPGLDGAALAVRLYQTVEMVEVDAGFSIEAQPARSEAETTKLRAAVLRAVRMVASRTGGTPSGLQVIIDQTKLAGCGLGLSAGLPLGCAVAINALFSGPLNREEILELALEFGCRSAPTVAAMLGNLAVAADEEPATLHTVVPAASQEIILVAPRWERDGGSDTHNHWGFGQVGALLVEALRAGDFRLLHALSAHVMSHRSVRAEWVKAHKTTLEAGASAFFVHERECSAAVFTQSKHDKIVEALTEACPGADIWRTQIETRGISIDALDVSTDESTAPIPVGRRLST